MKKYKLEISIGCILGGLIALLMWQSLAAKHPFAPYIVVFFFASTLFSILFPKKGDKLSEDKEKFAPKYFAQIVLSSIIGIGVIVSITVVLNRPRFSTTFDLTQRKVNSLSEETEKYLDSLDKEVEIYCIDSSDPRERYCEQNSHLRQLYTERSSKIKSTQVDFRNVPLLQKIKPTGYSRLIILSEDNRNEISGKVTESRLTNGIIGLIKSKKAVYFLGGSGEPTITGESEKTYAGIADVLRNRAYDPKEHAVSAGALPVDAQLVIGGSTQVAYNSVTEKSLRKLLARGGKLILTVNPYRPLGLTSLLSDIGIQLDNNVLLGNQGATELGKQLMQLAPMRPPVVIGEFNKESPMSAAFRPQDIALADGARSITILADNPHKDVLKQTVIMSAFHAGPVTLSEDQRRKLPLEGPLNLKFNPHFDTQKTYPVGVHVVIDKPSYLDPESKGDDKFPGEVVLLGFEVAGVYERAAPANAQILPLAVAQMYQDKELISIPNKDFDPKPFDIQKNPAGWLLLFTGILPILTALMGFYIWMRRRTA